jgi:hypothetical protein
VSAAGHCRISREGGHRKAKANPLSRHRREVVLSTRRTSIGRMSNLENAKANPLRRRDVTANLPNEAKSSRRIEGFGKTTHVGRPGHAGRHPLPNGTPVANTKSDRHAIRTPPQREDAGEFKYEKCKSKPTSNIVRSVLSTRRTSIGRMSNIENAKANPLRSSRRHSKFTKRSQIIEGNRGFRQNGSRREAVARGQAPPPEWHAGRQYEERPPRHPDSPAKRRRGGVNTKSAKANPLRGIAEKCPEYSKDLHRQDVEY